MYSNNKDLYNIQTDGITGGRFWIFYFLFVASHPRWKLFFAVSKWEYC